MAAREHPRSAPARETSAHQGGLLMIRKTGLYLCLLAMVMLTGACAKDGPKISDYSQDELKAKARTSLQALYASSPEAKKLRAHSVGILVFPDVFKAGFIVGGSGGNGVLFSPDGQVKGYFNVASASFGLQAGAQSFSEALFLTSKEALDYLGRSEGWSLGVGPSIVVVEAGAAKDLSTTTARYDVFAFIYGQKGLMGGIGVQGQKITRLKPQ